MIFRQKYLPVIYIDTESPNMVSIHVIPECETVPSCGGL